ncbi:U32 family peptidase [Halobacteriovorax sp. DA5]|uniref:U32 family peptidase n=1 Tax=Halobacteriovorax sp. DA5 TaxID=2067553 RepID=UPI000CD1257A|nr:U32 family peptidase [Halobacteriovorax sp. DA5]POB12928.1 collagenase [Halobacteriovorax sp. DA5]
MKKSEILAPVGNMQMCLAAIHGGADAIYVGMPGFNARGRTHDHSVGELKEMIDMCHLYGVKVHVAFNILIFEEEITDAIERLNEVVVLGPDALIIQDIGLANLVRQIYPDQVIHGSTQMTVTNHDHITFLEDLDIKRFVLGRENSIPEIKEIRANTERELEVFTHGALCVAYSGQCFTSESIGGRSANRGQCAQSCRFSYEMFVDGKKEDLTKHGRKMSYLVSPQDLCGIEEVNELQDMGIDSFKIEGRLKGPAYVSTAAGAFKAKLEGKEVSQKEIDNMALTYSRGLFSGWLHGVDHQQLVKGNYGAHRGIELGKIKRVDPPYLEIDTDRELENGMGVAICDDNKGIEIGSSIFSVKRKGKRVSLSLAHDFKWKQVRPGMDIYLNSDPKVAKESESLISDINKQKRIPVEVTLLANAGEKLTYIITDGQYKVIRQSDDLVEEARKPADLEKVEKDACALSRTIYSVSKFDLKTNGKSPFIHSKALKKLRQEAIEELNSQRVSVKAPKSQSFKLSKKEVSENEITLNFLLRDFDQVKQAYEVLKNCDFERLLITLDFEFGKDYKPSLELLKQLPNCQVGVATNRILKPKEYHHLNVLTRLDPDFILCRNLGSYQYLRSKTDVQLKGDFSLNVANSQTANYLLDKGFETLTSSYDLNAKQLENLLTNTDAGKIEVNIHQYMPSFHMEHCVYAAFLSEGSSFKDCGKPCEKHHVELKDQFGNMHFIKADQECRNTMFNAIAQSSTDLIDELIAKGVSQFRIELLNEHDDKLKSKLEGYLNFFNGKISTNELKSMLGTQEKYGIGTGMLMKEDTYQARKN